MTSEEWMALVRQKYREQDGKCAYCEKPLGTWKGAVELAHLVPRGQLKRGGVKNEWHPKAVALVCTRKGKNCNDGVMLPIGIPRKKLIEEIVCDESE